MALRTSLSSASQLAGLGRFGPAMTRIFPKNRCSLQRGAPGPAAAIAASCPASSLPTTLPTSLSLSFTHSLAHSLDFTSLQLSSALRTSIRHLDPRLELARLTQCWARVQRHKRSRDTYDIRPVVPSRPLSQAAATKDAQPPKAYSFFPTMRREE
ncbi:hypothetical protein VTJ04DRAFT_6172 [Mycothermus thermophilus]|uniref:uncharacterized protein n=1 Tax=Humicola insolens TaxID=85995 RepID=UPI003743D71E